jgi:hypothetical protein
LTKSLNKRLQDAFFLLRARLEYEKEKFHVEQMSLEWHAPVRQFFDQVLDD